MSDPHRFNHGELFPSLGNAREWLEEHSRHARGAICPCCERFTKIYKRKMTKGMAEALIWMYGNAREFVSMPERAPRWIHRSQEFHKLEYWALTERKPNFDDPGKHESGFWRITGRGEAFVEGSRKELSHALMGYGSKVLGFTGDEISISTALGRPFHYRELMNATP